MCVCTYISGMMTYLFNFYVLCLYVWYSESAVDVDSLKSSLVTNIHIFTYKCIPYISYKYMSDHTEPETDAPTILE